MENSSDDNKNHFNIHASIIFQLGESLISDPVQALVELIKNAYDADSPYVTVEIATERRNDVENSHFRGAKGFITIRDGGEGMDMETIINGWLTISNSMKRDMKDRGRTTSKGRTPLGDKGLGRLGAQRLGYNLEIFTKREDEPFQYHVAFSWRDFENKSKLDDVEIYTQKIPSTGNKGTLLLISELKEQNFFKADKAKDTLATELSMMLSPYHKIEKFSIAVKLNGNDIELAFASFNKKILNASQVNYSLNFDGENFEIKGKVRLSFLRPPQGAKKLAAFSQLVEVDQGKKFFDYLSTLAKAKAWELKKSEEDGWFVEYQKKFLFKDIDSLEFLDEEAANPGKFTGRIDSFDLGQKNLTQNNIFNIPSEYKKLIKNLYGIKVYRDGFGIRVDRDWLELGKQSTSGRSYYGLRVENTIGYIALSAKENKNLVETTDREGFKKNPYYNNFFKILGEFVKFTGDVQQFLRRCWLEFYKNRQAEIAKVDSGISPEELSRQICRNLAHASAYHTKVDDLKVILKNKVAEEQETISSIAGNLPDNSPGIKELKASVNLLKGHIGEAEKIVFQVDDYLKEIGDLEARVKVLESQVIILREQVADYFETASLGLTAEALSHEINTIADRLMQQTLNIYGHIKRQPVKDPVILTFIEHVKTTVETLRKQLAHLAPSLNYVREKREKIEILSFFNEIESFYHYRLKNNKINVRINPDNAVDFHIHINRGKLTQIFDNLFLNSEYWLREDLRTKNIDGAAINITIDKPYVRFSDTGRGVDLSVETTLFEPFVTTKGKGKGRGLGLFIVQQFLDAEGCTIKLLPDRNQHHRLYIFEIDFTGSMNDG
ncbi:MAG: ATP-binding protein [Candidatus Aminicenantes bacterium]|nr:ATP-binding protein [Candidatus Aminicenantes bacterium]